MTGDLGPLLEKIAGEVRRACGLISDTIDHSGPLAGGVALWLFTVTGLPLFVRAFRTSDRDYEPEIVG